MNVAPNPAAPVFLAGVHGGAGTTTLALVSGLREVSAAPGRADDRLVLVARMNAWGMTRAQVLLAAVHEGRKRAVIEGLVLVADAPGRPPRELTQFADLLASVLPEARTWRLRWVEAWRTNLDPRDTVPRHVTDISEALQSLQAAATH